MSALDKLFRNLNLYDEDLTKYEHGDPHTPFVFIREDMVRVADSIKPAAAELAALRERVATETAKKELLEKLAKIVYEKLKKDIEPVKGVGCEWELGVIESIDAYFEMTNEEAAALRGEA